MYLSLNRAGRGQPRFSQINGASFDRLFNEFFQPVARTTAPSGEAASTIAARFDVVEKTDRFEARIDMPGVDKNDIDVQIDGASVRVKADVKNPVTDEGTKVLHSNRATQAWHRAFTLPAEVDESRAEAAYENGVLTLTLPKKEVAQPKRLAIK